MICSTIINNILVDGVPWLVNPSRNITTLSPWIRHNVRHLVENLFPPTLFRRSLNGLLIPASTGCTRLVVPAGINSKWIPSWCKVALVFHVDFRQTWFVHQWNDVYHPIHDLFFSLFRICLSLMRPHPHTYAVGFGKSADSHVKTDNPSFDHGKEVTKKRQGFSFLVPAFRGRFQAGKTPFTEGRRNSETEYDSAILLYP